MSRRLLALESALGVPLFYRTADGYTLTPHGNNVISSAEAMEAAALAFSARAREKSVSPAGRVRIALPPEFASHWLAPNLPAFQGAYPQIELQILVGTRQRNLWRGEADLAVQSPRPSQPGVVAVRLARTTFALSASKAITGASKLRITTAESMNDLPLLTYTSSFDLLQNARWFRTLRDSARVSLTTNSTHALLSAARAGAGVVVLPRMVANQHDDLVRVSDNVGENDVWLVTHPEFRRDPGVRAAAEFLKRIASGPAGLS